MSIHINKGYCAICKQWLDLTENGELVSHVRPNGKKCGNKTSTGTIKGYVGEISLKVTRGK